MLYFGKIGTLMKNCCNNKFNTLLDVDTESLALYNLLIILISSPLLLIRL